MSNPDINLAPLAKGLENCAAALRSLGVGNASTSMGAVELLAVKVGEGCDAIASSIGRLASAVERAHDLSPGD